MVLLSLSSRSNQGPWPAPPRGRDCASKLEPPVPEEEDEALKAEVVRMLLHSVGGPEERLAWLCKLRVFMQETSCTFLLSGCVFRKHTYSSKNNGKQPSKWDFTGCKQFTNL